MEIRSQNSLDLVADENVAMKFLSAVQQKGFSHHHPRIIREELRALIVVWITHDSGGQRRQLAFHLRTAMRF